ncbi:NADH-quinone oxidoreductase subunit NuoH [Pseudoduganella sp. FT93W]|uniref:NADH-quinone oxidoreductase subunit H n=1 Tax=Duganella fentianensis TaxID=2692177 RepID=A0A845I367_9BURK|nr:NADH-quinone oxidoreductase subunit NuoH [Duganella fentianensis]MYN45198.1 NADH-quinone oxidoreductase subunit NuoH [Duganella fentianensis]
MALPEFVTTINAMGANSVLAPAWPLIWAMIRIVVVLLPLMGLVAYLTLWERKFIGWIQIRVGPNRVGPAGLLQPIADALKLLFKEIITPAKANPGLFVIGPIMTIMPALAAWSVVPFGPEAVLANVNAGLLLLMAITSMEVYGIIIAGWASNSKYSFLGAMRASAQMISYEIPMGFVLVVILMVSGSLNFGEIVASQQRGMMAAQGLNLLSWNWLPLLPLFVVYLTSGLAECNRHPFDVVEGESEIVAGHMVEYSGMAYAMFMLAEYANMILIATLASIMFLGGWSAPLAALEFWGGFGGFFWLFAKVFFLVSVFIWVRGTFPRYRYDQIMRLGWKVFIPLTLVYLVLVAGVMQTSWNIWK